MISHFFIDRPIFASVLSVVLVIAGGIAYVSLPVAQYPEITPPTVQVSAFFPGANARTVSDTIAQPIGITLDPTAVKHLWVVDNGTDRVYQYDNAVGRTSGSLAASTSFALAPGNANPQDIADPPAPATLPASSLPKQALPFPQSAPTLAAGALRPAAIEAFQSRIDPASWTWLLAPTTRSAPDFLDPGRKDSQADPDPWASPAEWFGRPITLGEASEGVREQPSAGAVRATSEALADQAFTDWQPQEVPSASAP